MSSTTPVAEYHDREAWLEARKGHLTASEIMATIGRHPFKTPIQLQRQKLGLDDPTAENNAMRRGSALEPIAVEEWERKTGLRTRRVPFKVHPERPLFACSADRQVLATPAEPTRLLEIKVPGWQTFSKIQREGLPDYIIGQVHVQGAIWGYDAVHLGILHADSFRLLDFVEEVDYDFAERLFDNAEAWWERHVVGEEPIDLDVDPDELDIPESSGELILVDDSEWIRTAEALLEARELRQEAETTEKVLKERLKALTPDYGLFQGGSARIRVEKRKGRSSFQSKALIKALPLDRDAVQTFVASLGEEALEAFKALEPDLHLDLAPFYREGNPYEVLTPRRIVQEEF